MLDWGYPLLLATLVQAIALSTLLILAPLAILRGRAREPAAALRLRATAYFGAVGLAFLFIEIAFIQKVILFLSHPVYAVSVVLFGFLLSAGLGAGLVHRFARLEGSRRCAVPAAVIAALCVGYVLALPARSAALIGLPDWARIACTVALIFPLGIAMGLAFPVGLEALAAAGSHLVPWGWGVNACASVVSACLATLLAIHVGFTVVILAAAGLSGLAAMSFLAVRM